MARTLTTPEIQPDAVQQAISGFRFEIPHVYDVTEMKLSKLQISVWYEVITYDTDGGIIKKETRRIPFQVLEGDPQLPVANWPAAFTLDAKAVYEKLHTDAVAEGLIAGAGTDEPLE